MKKLFAILMSLMVLTFTQCKPDGNQDDNNEKVQVICEVPINDGKSDFSNLMEDGSIKWSVGTERIYLAIPNVTTPMIVELTTTATQSASVLVFSAEIYKDMITENAEYDIWYFGNSKNLDLPYIQEIKDQEGDLIIRSIEGSIANQSGKLSDLGYCHIAKATVKAIKDDNGNFVLRGSLSNVIAIAYLNMKDASTLYGSAIKGTEYKLQYNSSTGKYEFVVVEDPAAVINVTDGTEESFVVLLPNQGDDLVLNNNNNKRCNFTKGIKSNDFYCRRISEVEIGPLDWGNASYLHYGREYVDLGLSVKWAKYNVGASETSVYGNYYAWGETEIKTSYHSGNSKTYGKEVGNISGDPQYDAASANWGGSWRMPTKDEMQELINNCTWTWTTQNGVNGYLVTGKNNNSIFLPASGYKGTGQAENLNVSSYYWSGSLGAGNQNASRIYFNSTTRHVESNYPRYWGHVVRPVWK